MEKLIDHPPLFLPPFHNGNGHQPTLRGPGPASLPERYGVDASFHRIWGPFGKGTGLFLRAVSVRNDAPTRVEALERGSTKRLLFPLSAPGHASASGSNNRASRIIRRMAP